MRRMLTAFIFVAFPLASALAVGRPGLAQQTAADVPSVALASLDLRQNELTRAEMEGACKNGAPCR